MDDEPATLTAVQGALAWLKSKQVLDLRGDWIARRPDVAPGGWAFQYANPHYPDLDDTAVVAGILQIAGDPAQYGEAVTRATDWLVALQSENGGFAAFDADNCFYYLNYIPFADHGALLDPPTADVTGRVLTLLGILKRAQDKEVIRRGIEYLKKEQEPEGCWWGRWGTNYIYGTWSALVGLVYAGEDPSQPYIARAIAWLESKQHEDGGWGETNDTYADRSLMGELPESTAYSAAWAVLALLVAGQARSEATRRGIAYLLREQQADGLWYHRTFTAPGFPRVFYLKYHGYTAYFPLWALARYRNLTALRPVR
jgi:squalene-hopene/tetraprenyl-beta-curcumene cyclase